ncbi:RNA-splicing factor [Tulasnella sp. 408]|nr:RNA-splicing factor [Tulasnella sp. 408]
MGGGDLNMKKSWHPHLIKNQIGGWLKEQESSAERKKLEQLRKEREDERQLQELQRLQEEQTGKKRQGKVDWMYVTPATGGGPSVNDLEDYLLGKKRVDKILIGNEKEKVGASHKDFIANQNANTARDTAAQLGEDPSFAIKQHEQVALKQVMENPLRMGATKEKAGIKDEDEKREKKEKRKHKHRHRDDPNDEYDSRRSRDRRRTSSRRSHNRSRSRSRSPLRMQDRLSRSPPSRSHDRYPDSPPRNGYSNSKHREGLPPRHRRSRSPPRYDDRRRREDPRGSSSRDAERHWSGYV